MTDHRHTNALIDSSSPYLLQHAHNPVNWLPWGPEVLEKAVKEDKPIIVSIGYSACHWCHVMERESFEHEDIAAIMNEHFICIKVDREERPDVDQVYMDAVHAMGLQGGWPLNVFLLPDQRPFYGGTYFPPKGWAQLCNQIGKVFREQRQELESSAEGFMKSLGAREVDKYGLKANTNPFSKKHLRQMFLKHEEQFDLIKGGNQRAPKFPMPVTYRFLLFEGYANNNSLATDHALRTVDHMAWGGLYDQVGGGFTRYSTDIDWFVPHFEKMLYDNGQLLTLYAEAFQVSKDDYYREVVEQTIDWLFREMQDKSGAFYSALDADSEGEEGKFYLWTEQEFKEILGPEAELMMDFYNITSGNWETQKNIPFRSGTVRSFADQYDLDIEELNDLVKSANLRLLKAREERIRPGLDDKILTSWNGLVLTGLCHAFAVFRDQKYLIAAQDLVSYFKREIIKEDLDLWHNYKDGKASIAAYLEDYAALIQGLISYYQVSFEEEPLRLAEALTEKSIQDFYDAEDGFFFFTSSEAEALIARKKEIWDNVIPSSNAMMAENLLDLSLLVDRPEWQEMASSMVNKMDRALNIGPQDAANWARIYGRLSYPTAEIAMVSDEPQKIMHELNQHYIPNKVLVAKKADIKSDLPLLEGRAAIDGKDTLFLCYNKACQLPVHEVKEVIDQIALSHQE